MDKSDVQQPPTKLNLQAGADPESNLQEIRNDLRAVLWMAYACLVMTIILFIGVFFFDAHK